MLGKLRRHQDQRPYLERAGASRYPRTALESQLLGILYSCMELASRKTGISPVGENTPITNWRNEAGILHI